VKSSALARSFPPLLVRNAPPYSDNYDLWLDPGMTNVEARSEMLKPYDARQMRCYPISTRINHVVNDDAECAAPVELTETQVGLFS
jgi:putative SOS response-associated peptidase YedK